jgi:hypothetical protein
MIKWKLPSKISVDGGALIISDEQNFPKYFRLESSLSLGSPDQAELCWY